MPTILDPNRPAAGDSPGLGDDEIRELKRFIADTFGLPVSPNQLTAPIGSTTTGGVFTFASAPKGGKSLPGTVGFLGFNNPATPTTKFDMSSTYVAVKGLSDDTVIGLGSNLGTSIDLGLTGPAANGRDQAAAFPVASFIHFYWIYNSTNGGTAGLASLNPITPTLPAGYTHFVYVTTILKDGSGNLKRIHQRGSWVWFDQGEVLISNGTALIEVFVNYSSIVPDASSNIMVESRLVSNTISAPGFDQLSLGFISGSVASNGPVIFSTAIVGFTAAQMRITLPNIGLGGLYYRIVQASTSAISVAINIVGYQVPNGDS